MREIRTLTGLRGYAALWVCIFHIAIGWPADPGNPLLSLAKVGNFGVTVFFVLSGFILSYVYQDWFQDRVTPGEWLRFMRLRMARIYPLHVLLLVVVAILIWAGVAGREKDDNAVSFILNLLLLHGWHYPNSVSWNLPSWTISVEFFAYLLFPFAALAMNRWAMAALVAATAYALYVPIPYWSWLLTWVPNPGTLQFGYGNYLVRYFGMFLLGMLVFRLVAKVPMRRWEADVIAAAGLAWLISSTLDRNAWTVPYASALLILGLAADKGFGRLLFGNPVAMFLGHISYALYLSHVMVITLWFAWTKTGPTRLLPVLAAALVVATVLHYTFEIPARRWLRPPARKPDPDHLRASPMREATHVPAHEICAPVSPARSASNQPAAGGL